jgi:hypothetical protein
VCCKQETPAQKAIKNFNAVEMSYRTNNIRGVEKTLLNYIHVLSDEESNRVTSIDFDMTLARVHQRLFLIYRKTRETNKMEHHYQESIKYMRKYSEKIGYNYVQPSHEALAAGIEKGESGLNVKWKKE